MAAIPSGLTGSRTELGNVTVMVVPTLAGLSRRTCPPSASTRSTTPISPEPPLSEAPPTPSSETVACTSEPSKLIRMETTEAWECFVVLVRPSETGEKDGNFNCLFVETELGLEPRLRLEWRIAWRAIESMAQGPIGSAARNVALERINESLRRRSRGLGPAGQDPPRPRVTSRSDVSRCASSFRRIQAFAECRREGYVRSGVESHRLR